MHALFSRRMTIGLSLLVVLALSLTLSGVTQLTAHARAATATIVSMLTNDRHVSIGGHTVLGSSPAVANGVVYIGSGDHKVYALNATTGAKLWSYTTGGEGGSSPAVVNGVVYIGSGGGNVYA